MQTDQPPPVTFYRCAGPNCGQIKNATDHWWLMWSSYEQHNRLILSLCAWDEKIAQEQGAVPVCGELCAHRLQSQFMGNTRSNELRSGT